MRKDPTNRRKPALAALLSLVQPGLGHVYAGRFNRAVAVIAIALAVASADVLLLLSHEQGRWIAYFLDLVPIPLYVLIVLDAVLVARRAPVPYVLKRYNTPSMYALLLVFGLGLARGRVWLNEFYVRAFRVPSVSMQQALLVGDWIYVDLRAAARRVSRDSLIVFRAPDNGVIAIKRIVGVPGDLLAMRNDTLMRNGQTVSEPWVTIVNDAHPDEETERMKTWGPVRVPQDDVFVLGDNRHASNDSRNYGFVPSSHLMGKPRLVYYSFDPDGDSPLPFLTAIRWNRIGISPH